MKLPGSQSSYAGAAVLVGVVAAALLHSRPRGRLPELHPLTQQSEREFYVAAAEEEAAARKKAAGRFRGSPWSQDDEFHNKEAKFLRVQARSRRTSIATMIDTLDRAMHEGWPTAPYPAPPQKVLPCRPRLNY
jgi:hypothetical protein